MAVKEKPEHGDGSWASRYFQAPQFNGQLPVSPPQFEAPAWFSKQYAHNLNLGIDIFGAWLTGGRRLIDAWRDSVRRQQDILLNGMRKQIETDAEFSGKSFSDAGTIVTSPARANREPRTAKQPTA